MQANNNAPKIHERINQARFDSENNLPKELKKSDRGKNYKPLKLKDYEKNYQLFCNYIIVICMQ